MNSQPQQKFDKIADALPAEFLDNLVDNAFETLTGWLRNNQVPDQIIKLINDVDILRAFSEKIRLGQDLTNRGEEILDVVTSAARCIAELGGVFSSKNTETIARDPIKWEPGSNKPDPDDVPC